MPSSTDPAYSLTTTNASSTQYTLTIMTVVAVIFTPIVLIYQGWTYWVFRKRVVTPPAGVESLTGRPRPPAVHEPRSPAPRLRPHRVRVARRGRRPRGGGRGARRGPGMAAGVGDQRRLPGRAGVDALAGPLAALAVVLAARALLGWASEITAQRISGAVKSDLRVRLLERAVALGPRWAADQASGEVALLATRGLDALDGYFGRYLPQLALAAIVPVAVVACLFAVDVVAALTVALTVPLIPVFMVLVGKMSAAHRSRRWATLGRLAHRFLDVVAGLPTLRAYGRADAQVVDPARHHRRVPLHDDGDAAGRVPLGPRAGAAGDDLGRAGGGGRRPAAGRGRPHPRGGAVRAGPGPGGVPARCAAWARSSTPARRA